MGVPPKLLGEGETVVLDLRSHPKVLILPGIVLIGVAVVGGATFAALPDTGQWSFLRWVVVGLGALAVIVWSVMPFLTWWGASYSITSERLITRKGFLTRTGRDIPLSRINDVAFEQGLTDRIFGCGTLIVSAASEYGTVAFRDIPHVTQVQLTMSEMVRDTRGWAQKPLPSEAVTPAAEQPQPTAAPVSDSTAVEPVAPEFADPANVDPPTAPPTTNPR